MFLPRPKKRGRGHLARPWPLLVMKKPWATLELPTASVHIQELISGQTPPSTTSTTNQLKYMGYASLLLSVLVFIAKGLKDVKYKTIIKTFAKASSPTCLHMVMRTGY